MAVGTGITVSAMAALAVFSKNLAMKFAGDDSGLVVGDSVKYRGILGKSTRIASGPRHRAQKLVAPGYPLVASR